MFKKLSKLSVILLLILTMSVSLFACQNPDDNSGDNGALAEFNMPYAYTDGVHDYTNVDMDEWLVKDGITSYVLYLPSAQSDQMKIAREEFELLFEDATGINILSVTDAVAPSPTGKYISFGENALFDSINVNPGEEGYDPEKHISDADYDKESLTVDGVRIITKGDDIFLLGGSDYGVVNAVYTFMALHFNYEYYYRNCIVIDTDVKDEHLKNFNVKDIPDIARRSHNVVWYSPLHRTPRNNDLATGLEYADIWNSNYRARLTAGMSTDFLPVFKYENYKTDTESYIHNIQEFFPQTDNQDSTLYVNYKKYFYDEYKPNSDMFNADGTISLDPYAPSRAQNDADGDGIPDNWKWGDGDGVTGDSYDKFNDIYGAPAGGNSEVGTFGAQSDWWNGVSVCHTAHGNANSYEALAKRVADCAIFALRYYPREKYPDKRTLLFSMEDAGTACSCDACNVNFNKFNAHTASINMFLNDVVRRYVRPWMEMEGNEDYRRDDFVLSYFCYAAFRGVPTCNNEEYRQEFNEKVVCDKNVGTYIAGLGINRSTDIYDDYNKSAIKFLTNWGNICDNIMIWGYSVAAHSAIYFSDSLTAYNSSLYQLLANMGSYYMFNESQDVGDEATCWQNFNSYYQAKLMWDTTLDTGVLFENYFDAMYLDASETMKEIYQRMRVHRQVLVDLHSIRNQTLSGTQIANQKFWPLSVLEGWTELFKQALSEVEKYKTVDNGLYNLLVERIELEMTTSVFITVHLYADQLSTEEINEYKQVLYRVTDRFPDLRWKGSYSSSIREYADSL